MHLLVKEKYSIIQLLLNHNYPLGLHGKLTGAGGGGFAFVLIPTDFGESTVTSVREKLSEEGFTVLRTKVGGGGVTVSMMKQ